MRGKKLLVALALVTGAALARGGDPPAGRPSEAALAALGAGAGAVRVPVPPYRRTLQGKDARRARALETQIRELWAAGNFAEAVDPAQEAADLRRRAQGADHWEAADAVRQVEILRRAAALPAEARAALAEAPGLARDAAGLLGRRKYAEAEPLLRKRLEAYERALGAGHPATAQGYNDLAASLDARGRYAEAEALYRRALAAWEKALGPDHPHTAAGYNNLAACLYHRERYAEAEALFRRALAAREAALGPDHPETARGYNNLAACLRARGRNAEAEALSRRAGAAREAAPRAGPPDRPAPRAADALAAAAGPAALLRPEPPYQRMLQGADAERAAALDKQIKELWAAVKFAEALEPAEELLALRRRRQGKGHWQAVGAALEAEALRKAADLPADRRAALAEAPALLARGSGLTAAGKHAEAEPLLRQGTAALEAALGPTDPCTATGYNNLADNLQAQERHAEAEPLLRKALAALEGGLGPHHPVTAVGYCNLGLCLRDQGRHAEAEPLLRKALAAFEAALGPSHPLTATGCNSLARTLDAQGRHRDAEPLFRKAVAVRERILSPNHPDTGESCIGLAASLFAQGRYSEAEPLFRKALAIREAVRGPAHPLTAQVYNNLARTLDARGRYAEAEPLHRRAAATLERALGPNHSDTTGANNDLALNLQFRGHHAEAEPLFRHALAVAEAAHGPAHPDTARAYNNLASNLHARGRYAEAEALFRRALATDEAALGPAHPDTSQACGNLAGCLNAQGRIAEAEALWRKALAAQEAALGPGHPDTALGYNNLAGCLLAQGRYAEAEPLLRRALASQEAALGPDHPDTAQSYNNLAYSFRARGRFAEAERLYRKALTAWEKALGPGHPRTAYACSNLAEALKAQGRLGEAEALYRKALAALEKALGPAHPDTATGTNNLALNLEAQGRSGEAEPLLRRALATLEVARGPAHPDSVRAYWNLAVGLRDRGRYAEAEPLLRAAAEGLEAARLRLAVSGLDRATAVPDHPHLALAACQARLGRRAEAWGAAEAGLARGLLDDLAARASLPPDPQRDRRDRERAARLAELDRLLTPLVAANDPDEADRRRRDELLKERAALDAEAAREAAALSRQAVLPLEKVQGCLAPDEALVFWLDFHSSPDAADPGGEHWGCVLRRAGPPAWARLSGTGENGAWVAADDQLPGRLHGALARGEPDAPDLARRLAAQQLGPLAPHLAARGGRQAARRLVVVPVGRMTVVPLEALTDAYLVSYAPSGSLLARLRETHRPLRDPTLLALGDPNFAPPDGGALEPAPRGARGGESVADSRDRSDIKPLPGTRREARALAALLPPGKSELLLGSDASEQRLGELAASGKLKGFRLVHLATHGTIDPGQAGWSALLLARDKLPGPEAQAKLAAAGKKVPTGRLTVETIAREWQLDADLVTLSACETGLGRFAGGEGLLGFSQVLLAKGARSLVLSLWKVDDTATALLMTRFYENLLGKRDGLKAPLPKAEALREAKTWLRQLPRAEAEALAARLGKGELRGSEVEARPVVREEPKGGKTADAPYAHPRYWAAFVLIGDPD
jgi:CHAT domain-containing protein/tetratricopeptide (TPR) repeat protein